VCHVSLGVGACSDRYIRFWDLETHHILCSCVYYHLPEPAEDKPAVGPGVQAAPTVSSTGHTAAAPTAKQPAQQPKSHHHHHKHHHGHHKHHQTRHFAPSHANAAHVAPDEVLRILKVSDSEDLLIGTFILQCVYVALFLATALSGVLHHSTHALLLRLYCASYSVQPHC
jgi:hypothetical protein